VASKLMQTAGLNFASVLGKLLMACAICIFSLWSADGRDITKAPYPLQHDGTGTRKKEIREVFVLFWTVSQWHSTLAF
jgi:hypothetical protein